MSIEIIVIVSGLILFAMVAMLATNKKSNWEDNTTAARNGISYHKDKNVYTGRN